MVSGKSVWDLIPQLGSTIKVSTELPVTTRHRRDMTDNVESDVKSERTNKQTNNFTKVFILHGRVFTIYSHNEELECHNFVPR